MKYLAIALLLSTPALAQDVPLQIPHELCPDPTKACSAAYDNVSGQWITEHTYSSNGYTRMAPAKFIYSLEETAISYFQEVVSMTERGLPEDDVFHPKNVLRDRDGLNADEAQEVIGVALNYDATLKAGAARHADKAEWVARAKKRCVALNQATSPDEQWDAVEADAADELKHEKEKGKALLAQLSPATRAHVRKVLVEYRDSMTVSRDDIKKLREVKPESIAEIHAVACNAQARK